MTSHAAGNSNVGTALRQQLKAFLDGGQAHATFASAVKDFPASLRGTVPESLPYSAWQIVEHIRIGQRDILDYCRNTDGRYQHKKWPDEYWPKDATPPSSEAWDSSIRQISNDREAFEMLLQAADDDSLVAPFAWADSGQSLLREAFLVGDHEAYHTGELIVLRRLLGTWKK